MVDMLDSNTRSDNMTDGVGRARQQSIQSVQQLVHPAYVKTSVLDNLRPNANGMSDADLQRQMFGIKTQGQDQTTADRSVWLRNPAGSAGLYKSNLI